MAYEFKRLSDVEVAETISDSASVLIEEDGVIKRAPKDEIGGGIKVASTAEVGQTIVVKAVDDAGNPTEWECANLGAGYDAVIDLGVFTQTNLSDLSGGSIPAGTVAMINEKLNAGEMPKIQGVIAYQYYDTLEKSVFEFDSFGWYGKPSIRCHCTIYPYSGFHNLDVSLYTTEDGNDGFSAYVMQ